MKTTILSAALAASGIGWWAGSGTPGGADAAPAQACEPCPLQDCGECDVDVRCTPDGRCVITCVDPDGERCVIELPCDRECAPSACAERACALPGAR